MAVNLTMGSESVLLGGAGGSPQALGSQALSSQQGARRLQRRATRTGLLFISPWIIGFLAFTVYPFLASLFFSFTNYSIVSSPRWIGLANYRQLFASGLFWRSIYNTLFYTVLEVPCTTIIAIGIALLLNMRVKGIGIYRTVFFLPSIVPAVAGSILWLWLLNPAFGVANDVLHVFGLPSLGWIDSTTWSKPSLVLMGFWSIGTPMVIYLAALNGIPKHLYEAATLEGAGPWQRTRHVTLPMISPAVLFNVVMGLITSLQFFTQAYVMTNGGPGNSSEFYGLYMYQEAFNYLHMGYASAMAWLLFVVTMLATLALFRFARHYVFYSTSR